MSNILKIAASGVEAAAPTDYQIERSLRFNSADSAYLNRTPASAGNRKTWTWAGWVKRSGLGVLQAITEAGASPGTTLFGVLFLADDTIRFQDFDAGVQKYRLITTQVFRDVSSCYHLVFVLDTSNATEGDRVRMYVNGQRVNSFSTEAYPTQDYEGQLNRSVITTIGKRSYTDADYANYYLTEVHFVDGQALTADDFGETDETTGVWKPKAYTGTYGTNGFYLDFSDNSSTTALGYDAAGSNDWTPNNFSVTAGAGNDSLVDTPTPYGTDTGVGGEVRGNYCTWNPLANPRGALPAFSNGNLQLGANTTNGTVLATIPVSSGKWYWEVTVDTVADSLIGATSISAALTTNQPGYIANSASYLRDGRVKNNGSDVGTYATYTNGDIIGLALNMDDGELSFYKNNTLIVTLTSNISGTWVAAVTDFNVGGSALTGNFGQRPFAYTAPSGFKALCTQNLPTPTVVQGDDYFNTILWTGDGTGTTRTINGVGFQPDFVWAKRRSASGGNYIWDAIRGTNLNLITNSTSAEVNVNTSDPNGGVSTSAADGITIIKGTSDFNALNKLNETHVAWNWNAGGSNATNTDGTITSTVRANPTAGFSIVTATSDGTGTSRVGHGLGATPKVVIIKRRDSTSDWIYYTTVIDGSLDFLYLNTTAAASNSGAVAPNTTTFANWGSIPNGGTFVAYCFAEVEGFSKFGSYTGNGSADGPFVYCGFRPAFVIRKAVNLTHGWYMDDDQRNPFNVIDDWIRADISNAETVNDVNYKIDFVSNGFKVRTAHTTTNDATGSYIFMAFAENPFKHSLAR